MARVIIAHEWPDGGRTHLSMDVDQTFADCCDEARVQVVKMWRETCCDPAEAETEGES